MRPPKRSTAVRGLTLAGLLAVALVLSGCALANEWLEAHGGECPYGYLELARRQGYRYSEVCPPPYRSELDEVLAKRSRRQATSGADGRSARSDPSGGGVPGAATPQTL